MDIFLLFQLKILTQVGTRMYAANHEASLDVTIGCRDYGNGLGIMYIAGVWGLRGQDGARENVFFMA